MGALGLVEGCLLAGLAIALFLAYKLFVQPKWPSQVPAEGGDDVEQKNEAEEEDETGVPMTIIFGTQTGNAEEFAEILGKEAKKRGYKPSIQDIEEYNYEDDLEKESFAVFLMATFGEGEPTDSAQGFDGWLKKLDQRDMFKQLDFAVFALGNKQYEQFCEMGKRTDRRIVKLGGNRLIDVGLGDDDDSIEDDFNEWKAAFFTAADKKFQLGANNIVTDDSYTPEWSVKIVEDAAGYSPGYSPATDSKDNIEMSRVEVNRELRQKCINGGSTRHIEFSISDLSVNYYTADNLGIYPRNDQKTSFKLCKRLRVHTNDVFTANSSGRPTGLPKQFSAMDAMLWHLDINNAPKKSLISTLSYFATDDAEKSELKSLSTDKKRYDKEIIKPHTSVAALLEKFQSVEIPFQVFIEICPKLQPRFYTISSSSNAQPGRITITMSVLKGGVCTNYLAKLRPERDTAPVFVRPSTFRLPKQVSLPIIMIGPGTGLAPFMGFIQEFQYNSSKDQNYDQEKGQRMLYFGCRRSDEDFIYKEQLLSARKNGVLDDLQLAFSREGKEKVYVQHLMSKNGPSLYRCLERGGYIFVCGGTSMGREVKDAFVSLVRSEGGKAEAEARAYVESLSKSGRYVQELWSV